MHGLVALFLGVSVLAIINLVMGFVAPQVLVVALRAIVALIVLMMIVGLLIIAVMMIASCDSYDCDVDGSLIHGYGR